MVRRSVDVSVVVPTFNRRERLRRVLAALDAQRTTSHDGTDFDFEVVVVSDGSTDGTAEVMAAYTADHPVRFIEQDNAGPAAARNAGVAASRGDLVVFIDDDVIPEPGCLAAHVARHGANRGLVVIGPMLTPTDVPLSPWVAWEQFQLEKQYRRFDESPTAHHRQFYTGNASVARAAFERVGGFDTSFRRAEDVELAHRLHLDGLSFVFEPEAQAYHHAERSLESWAQMAYDYGRNDIRFAESGQPDILVQIRGFFSERHALLRHFIRLLLRRPRCSSAVRRLLAALVRTAERTGSSRIARPVLSVLYGVNYYRGVADGLGSARAALDLLDGVSSTERLAVWFVLEQTLGHVTHGKNLSALLPTIGDIEPVFVRVEPTLTGRWSRLPGWTNWTVRAGVRARRSLRELDRSGWVKRPHALFVHSQVPAVLLGRWMRTPTVVSLDATPMQYDSLGEFYNHDTGSALGERLKYSANRRCFGRARHLVTWSQWAKQGLVDEYDVDPDKITVIAPGVDIEQWARPTEASRSNGPLRVLFVGGDLERKGGHLLLRAAQRLRADADVPEFEVHLVTTADTSGDDGVVVHRNLTANSPQLIEQYHLADVFCLPTLGDCLPMVLAEAGAAGLPLISTDVGAISEVVRDGVTGRLVPPNDLDALTAALRSLLVDAALRDRCGRAARTVVEQSHDARKNADTIVAVLRAVVAGDA